jgi:hypothetical protein
MAVKNTTRSFGATRRHVVVAYTPFGQSPLIFDGGSKQSGVLRGDCRCA